MGKEYPKGIKWTKQRKDVYDILDAASEPLGAVQIYNKIVKSGIEGNYAVSTIYRILTAFEEQHLVNKSTWMDDGTVVYELNRGSHTHYAVCMACRKRVPLESCPFSHMHMHMPKASDDFEITGHKLELYGYCKQCKSSKM